MKTKRKALLWFDRILSQGLFSQLLMLMGLMLGAFLIAHLLLLLSPGDWGSYCEAKGISRWVAPLYLLIDANAFTDVYENNPGKLTVALSCIIYIIGIFLFTGMMVSVITNVIERRVEMHRGGLIHYLVSGHYVIMGYDDTICSFLGYLFLSDPGADILLLTSKSPSDIREKLLNSFSEEQLRHVIINYGHRTSADEFPKIHLESAREIFVVGYQGNSAHDAINIECLDAICNYLGSAGCESIPERITCVFRDLDTYTAFKTTDIFSKIRKLGIDLVPYNYNAGWAKQILTYRTYKDKDSTADTYAYPLIYGNGRGITPGDGHYVHLVFVGTTDLAVAIATEAAHILHFPNFTEDGKRRTVITFIDRNADSEKEEFITRYRHFFEVQPYEYIDLSTSSGEDAPVKADCRKERLRDKEGMGTGFLDISFRFVKGDVFSKPVQDLLTEWAEDVDNQYLSIFLAQAGHRMNFVMGMNMPDAVYDRGVPVFIRQDRSDNLVTNLRESSRSAGSLPYYTFNGKKLKEEQRCRRYSRIYPFGMNECVYNDNEVYLKRAKLINYLYSTSARFNYERFEEIPVLESIPPAQLLADADAEWRKLTVALRWSNLYNAYSIDTKIYTLRACRGLAYDDASLDLREMTESEVEMLARVEHNRWNVEKLLMGFRKPVPSEDKYLQKNADVSAKLKKNKALWIHHDIRPYGELDGVRQLDIEISRYIPWILKESDYFCKL